MELTIEQALQQGIAAHKEGKLQDADRLYRTILQSQPLHPDANHNLGVLAVSVNNLDAALPLFKTALEVNPNIEQFWISYIDALIKEKQFNNAKQVLEQAKKQGVAGEKLNVLETQLIPTTKVNEPKSASQKKGLTLSEKRKKLAENKKRKKEKRKKLAENNKKKNAKQYLRGISPSDAEINNLIQQYQNGQYGGAEKSALSLTERFPKHQFAWKVLAAVLKQTGRVSESLAASQKSVQLGPQDAEAHSNLGNTLKELGRLDEAEASYTQAIALKPDFALAHNNLGITLQEQGRLDEAEASLRQAIALKHVFAVAHNNLGATLKELDRLGEAEASLRQAIELKPDYAEGHNNLGNTLQELGRLDEAEASYTQAIALKPDYAEAHKNLGNTLQELGRLDEAEASYTQAIVLKSDYAEAHRHLALMKKFDSQDKEYSKMQVLYLDENISEEQRCHINFGLAKACEDLGDFEQAFQHYKEGNALRKTLLNYDINQDIELFKQLKSSNVRAEQNSLEVDNLANKPMPIFIVGMPRSGTTLVEQIISSHPQVTGAGELPFAPQFGASIATGSSAIDNDALLNFRGKYLTKLQNISNGNLIVTDKMPQNFRYIGLLAAAFPEAKIVHVKRNPAAVCWANYKQYFASKNIGYCYALDDVISYYRLYENLMEFWGNSLSKRIYNLDYELLTVNQENETHQLIDYLGLDWDEKCLSPQDNTRSVATASNMQVRKKVYQGSSQQWKKYEPFLNGALDGLLAP
jgi:tetratricopeptide (TPR) repeat protein